MSSVSNLKGVGQLPSARLSSISGAHMRESDTEILIKIYISLCGNEIYCMD